MRVWVSNAFLGVAFFAGLTLLFVTPWVNRQYRRFGRLAGWPAVISSLTILYACGVVAYTLFPAPDISATDGCAYSSIIDYWQLDAMATLHKISAYRHEFGWLSTLRSAVFLQVIFNVVLFVPLGFLLQHRWRRGIVGTALIGLGISAIIEVTQGTAVWGLFPCPYRTADVMDLIMNTTGAIAGWLVGFIITRWLPEPRPAEAADLDLPGTPRKVLGTFLDLLVFLVLSSGLTLVFEYGNRHVSWLPVGESTLITVIQVLVGVVLFLVVPLLRGDRATPGYASVDVAVVSAGSMTMRACWWSILIRFAIRWLPLIFFGLLAFLLVAAVDLVCALIRGDRRSFVDLVSRTRVVTLRSLESEHVSPAVEPLR